MAAALPDIIPLPQIKSINEPPPVLAAIEPFVSSSPGEPIAAHFQDDDEAPLLEEESPGASTVGRLRIVRTSPWPVMAIVGGMALVTVSAIGLRSGSSTPLNATPPIVASPPATLPDSYAPQLPAAPLVADETQAQPSTALGESPWRPTGPTARGSIATAAAPAVPAPVTAPPAAARVTPMVSPPAAAPPESPPPTATASPDVEEPAVASRRDAVTVVESPPSAPEPRPETPPAPASPAVSSAPAPGAGVSTPLAEVPRPAASRTVIPVVAARRLTGGMPEYSSALRRQKVGGVVEVSIRIDLNGRVVSAIAASGPPPLRQIAEAAVLKWRYAPATRNGIPTESESKVSFSFDPSQNRRP
jgi:periplasmic protein TonB